MQLAASSCVEARLEWRSCEGLPARTCRRAQIGTSSTSSPFCIRLHRAIPGGTQVREHAWILEDHTLCMLSARAECRPALSGSVAMAFPLGPTESREFNLYRRHVDML